MITCNHFADQLSAFIDHELDADTSKLMASHMEHCEQCKKTAQEYLAIGSLIRVAEPVIDTEAMWDRVELQLLPQKVLAPSRKWKWMDWSEGYRTPAFAVAASVLLLVSLVSYFNPSFNGSDEALHDHASLAVDFAEVFRYAKANPKQAVDKLASKFEGRELSREETTEYLGYEPALFNSVPEGFTRVSTHVLNMPCCKCSATICERSDGSSLIVFEHKDEQPVWFGVSPAIDTQCAGKSCKIVESAGQLAVSWRNQDRQITIVGANDITEVNNWVSSLKL